jgi:hypothetical protein
MDSEKISASQNSTAASDNTSPNNNRWYWKIWSPQQNISLPEFYQRIRQFITEPAKFILMGEHENLCLQT